MIRGLNGDDVSAEIRTQEQAESLDGVGFLWLASREAQLGELFVRFQHDHVRSKDDPGLLLLVVVDLYCGIVRYTERDHLGLVTLG